MHRNANTWHHPEEFIPARFEGVEGEKEKSKVLALSVGTRVCPAKASFTAAVIKTLVVESLKFDIVFNKIEVTPSDRVKGSWSELYYAEVKPASALKKEESHQQRKSF